MVKAVFLCRRRAGLTHAEYVRRLLGGHVPLALRHHPTMRRYVVHVVEEALGAAPALDSIGVLGFDSLDDYRDRLYDSPDGEAVVARDVAGFLGGADAYATREHVLRAAPCPRAAGARTPGTKLVLALRPPDDVSGHAFVRDWLDRRARTAIARPDVRGYVADVVERVLDGPPLAGFAEIHLDSAAGVDAVLALHAGAVAWRTGEYVQR
jgi:hypothetical protein